MNRFVSIILLLFGFIPAFAKQHYNIIRPGIYANLPYSKYFTQHTNIILPGTGDFWFNTGNFNTTYGVASGDTVVLAAGTYGHIDITNITGVTFRNSGQVIVDSWNFNNGATNCKILGNGTSGITYGIRFNGATNFAMRSFCTGTSNELGFLEVAGSLMGFQWKTNPGETYPSSVQNVYAHDLYIHDTNQEAIYFGSDELGGPFMTCTIERVTTLRTGRDGIQTRNGTYIIQDCSVTDAGLNQDPVHAHGILIGGNTNGGTIRRNTVTNTYGFGIFANGWGAINIYCNVVTAAGNSALFTKNYEENEDLQGVGSQTWDIQQNKLHSNSTRSIEMLWEANGSSGSAVIDSNDVNKALALGVPSTTNTNNTNGQVRVCSGGTSNQSPSASAGADQNIYYPTVTSTTLNGSGTDNDGTITAYAWTKVSGPSGGTIVSPSSASTNITGLIVGTYVYRLTVTDDDGATGADELSLFVDTLQDSGPLKLSGACNQIIENKHFFNLTDTAIDIEGGGNCNIIIRNCIFEELPTGIHAISAENVDSLTIINCTFKNVGTGIYVLNSSRIKVNNNTFLNMRGPGGLRGQFVQFDKVNGVRNEIKCNYGVNEPGLSDPEDAISLFQSNGTLASPILVEGNYIKGGGPSLTGGGIMLGDGGGTFLVAQNNVLINPGQYGMAIAGGSFNTITNNKIYAAQAAWTNVGIFIADYSPGDCSNNTITNNEVNWKNNSGAQNDFYFEASCTGTTISGNVGNSPNATATMGPPVCTPVSNLSPTANAGEDALVQLPTTTANLAGFGSDPDGTISTYGWAKVSGPAGGTITSPSSQNTTVTALQGGNYIYRLTVTDNGGATATDDVQITVNIQPTTNAGTDQLIQMPTATTSVTGTASDADGTVTTILWTKQSGPSGGNISTPAALTTNITALQAGTYVFRVTVTDDRGGTAFDELSITANPPPSVNAGADQAISATSTVLNGSASDNGSIASYSWTKISGTGGTITSPTVAVTTVTGLTNGTYVFRLTATDNQGNTAFDDISVVVNVIVQNLPPIADAGPDITSDEAGLFYLYGSGVDPDGTSVTCSWVLVGNVNPLFGPFLGNPGFCTAHIFNFNTDVQSYNLILTVTDGLGATDKDTMVFYVIREPPSNLPPTSNAGTDQIIVLPTNTTTLSGSGNDPDGVISAYAWTKISGPTGGNIVSPSSATTVINTLNEGIYIFRLTVTDNIGATATDDITVLVSTSITLQRLKRLRFLKFKFIQ